MVSRITVLLITLSFSLSLRAKEVSILFLGDSLTEGYGIKKELAYPYLVKDLIEKKEGKKLKIVNGSISGSTSSSLKSRYAWFSKAKFDYIFLAIGANDGLRGIPLSKTRANIDQFITNALADKSKVIMAGMLIPPNYGKDYGDGFKKIYEDMSKKHSITFIPFLLEGVAGEKELNQNDGIHPNEKGHQIMANTVYQYLRKIL